MAQLAQTYVVAGVNVTGSKGCSFEKNKLNFSVVPRGRVEEDEREERDGGLWNFIKGLAAV